MLQFLCMECDHPMVNSSDPKIARRRAGTLELKSACALLRDIRIEGKDVIGEVETISGFYGPSLAKTVLMDKLNLGFSLRALGGVRQEPDGTIIVLNPIKPIKCM